MRKFFYFIYFFLPFFIWSLIYLQKPDLIVILKRPVFEKSLIISLEDLWQVILIFFIFQLGNEILAKLISLKVFVFVSKFFIFFHLLIAFYLLIFNFF